MSDNAENGTDESAKAPNAGTLAMQASARAKVALMERYKLEYMELLGNEREKLGLSREPGPDKKTQLMRRLATQEKKIAQLRKQLEELMV